MKRSRNRQLGRHRFALGLLGLLLVAGGVTTLLLGEAVVDGLGEWIDAEGVVLDDEADAAIRDDQRWFQLGAMGAGLVLIVLGLWWLRRQVPARRIHHDRDLPPSSGDVPGTNTVRGGALAEALEHELEADPRISGVVAEVRADDEKVRLTVSVGESLSANELDELIRPAVRRVGRVAQMDGDPEVLTDVRLVHMSRQVA